MTIMATQTNRPSSSSAVLRSRKPSRHPIVPFWVTMVFHPPQCRQWSVVSGFSIWQSWHHRICSIKRHVSRYAGTRRSASGSVGCVNTGTHHSCLAAFGALFIVFAQQATSAQPSQGPAHCSSPGQRFKAVAVGSKVHVATSSPRDASRSGSPHRRALSELRWRQVSWCRLRHSTMMRFISGNCSAAKVSTQASIFDRAAPSSHPGA